MNCKSNYIKDCTPLNNLNINTLDISKNDLSQDEQFYHTIMTLKNLQKIYLDDNCFDESNILEENIENFINKKNERNSHNSNHLQNKIDDNESISYNVTGFTSESIFQRKNINNKLYEYFENNLSETENSFNKFDTKSELEFANDNKIKVSKGNLIDYTDMSHEQHIPNSIPSRNDQDQDIISKISKRQNQYKNHSFYNFESFKDKPKILKINKKDLKNMNLMINNSNNPTRSISPTMNSFPNYIFIKDSKINNSIE